MGHFRQSRKPRPACCASSHDEPVSRPCGLGRLSFRFAPALRSAKTKTPPWARVHLKQVDCIARLVKTFYVCIMLYLFIPLLYPFCTPFASVLYLICTPYSFSMEIIATGRKRKIAKWRGSRGDPAAPPFCHTSRNITVAAKILAAQGF